MVSLRSSQQWVRSVTSNHEWREGFIKEQACMLQRCLNLKQSIAITARFWVWWNQAPLRTVTIMMFMMMVIMVVIITRAGSGVTRCTCAPWPTYFRSSLLFFNLTPYLTVLHFPMGLQVYICMHSDAPLLIALLWIFHHYKASLLINIICFPFSLRTVYLDCYYSIRARIGWI